MSEQSAKPNIAGVSIRAGSSAFARYAAAFVCVTGAFLIRWLLDPLLGDNFAFLTFYGGVALAVWLSGWRPAALVALTGFLLANFFFVSPRNQMGLGSALLWASLFGYTLSCGLIIYLGEGMRRARDRAERQRELLATTLTSMGDAVIVTDANGHVTALNGEAERLTGWSSAEAAGRPHFGNFSHNQRNDRRAGCESNRKILA